jgi:hypothetical protein
VDDGGPRLARGRRCTGSVERHRVGREPPGTRVVVAWRGVSSRVVWGCISGCWELAAGRWLRDRAGGRQGSTPAAVIRRVPALFCTRFATAGYFWPWRLTRKLDLEESTRWRLWRVRAWLHGSPSCTPPPRGSQADDISLARQHLPRPAT